MPNDTSKYASMSPAEVRALIREGKIDFPTSGMCAGFVQANLIVLPADYAADFKEFAKKNPFPCPVLEVIEGTPYTKLIADNANILSDIPRYRIYRDGKLSEECCNAEKFWQSGMVGFLLGCSFSFEEALIRNGIEVRHITNGRNVPMYKTSIQTVPVGPFSGPMVCSMRPMTPENAKLAYDITAKMPNVHGAPVQMGEPEKVGVPDVMKVDYGDAPDMHPGEIPVFWPCGVTPQSVVENAKPPIAICHAPGHMFLSDILNTDINDFIEEHKHLFW